VEAVVLDTSDDSRGASAVHLDCTAPLELKVEATASLLEVGTIVRERHWRERQLHRVEHLEARDVVHVAQGASCRGSISAWVGKHILAVELRTIRLHVLHQCHVDERGRVCS